jgi:nitrous oxidase accessory protein NosD
MLHHVRTAFVPFAVAALISCAFATAAQAGRLSYVSSAGNDANACTLAAPCRTLTHAIAATTHGGEVRVIDSAGYGAAITIGKSITVSGDGATIFAGAITINNASAVVTLRGLVLNGGGAAASSKGVTIAAAETVHIERCTIHGFPQHGILLSGAAADLTVTDSIARDNGQNGVEVDSSTTARLTVDNSRFENNGNIGVFMLSGVATITRSLASGNGNHGFVADTATTRMTLDSSTARGNTNDGLLVLSGATAVISNSVFTNNAFGLAATSDATLLTRQNNTVWGNTVQDAVGTETPLGGL